MPVKITTTKPRSSTSHSNQKGAALITVVLFCTVILILIASYLSTLVTQQRLSYRAILQNEARNASEGVAAIALGEIERRATSQSGLFANANLLHEFELSNTDKELLAPTESNVIPDSLEFKLGNVSPAPSGRVFLDPFDLINRNDPDAGKQVSVRTVNLFAKATTESRDAAITSHVSKHIRIASGAWFDYAVFFNMDMEMHAGAKLDVGTTHANADIYLTGWNRNNPNSDEFALTFTDRVTATGRFYRFLKYHRGDWDDENEWFTATPYPHGQWGSQVARVYGTRFNDNGTKDQNQRLYNRDYIDAHPEINDSTRTDGGRFAEVNLWKGGMMDGTMNIPVFNPPGMMPYVPEDFDTTDIELRNHAYLMIEPQLPIGNGHKGTDLENLKFSAKAGLIIQVSPPANNGEQPQWKLVWYEPTDPGYPIGAGNPPVRGSDGRPIILGTIDPFNDPDDEDYDDVDADGNPVYTVDPVIQRALRLALLKAIISVPYKDNGSGTYGDGANNRTISHFTPLAGRDEPIKVEHDSGLAASGLATFNDALRASGNREDPLYYPIYDRREGGVNIKTSNDGGPTAGLLGAFHTIIIDMVKLHKALNQNALWLHPDGSGLIYDPTSQFSGLLYVEFPLAEKDNARFNLPESDKVRPALAPTSNSPGYAVLVRNAGGSVGAGHGTGLLPRGPWNAPGVAGPGFSLATNGPVYLWGHYNANGENAGKTVTMSQKDADWTTSHTVAGTPLIGEEIPALIAADAVTVLSSTPNNNPGDFPVMTRRIRASPRLEPWPGGTAPTDFTETSSAILSGIVPTRPGFEDIWSGGVHNFVRFVQNWQGTDWTPRFWGYRGSMVALFESEVAKAPYREGDSIFRFWFDGPDLVVGHHPDFLLGIYPPGTPVIHTVRCLGLSDISASEYDAGPTQPPAYH